MSVEFLDMLSFIGVMSIILMLFIIVKLNLLYIWMDRRYENDYFRSRSNEI